MSDEMKTIMQDSNSNLNPNELNGCIMYIHGNIPENTFNYKETFCMAFYLAMLSVNDNIKNFTK
jgi:hypothetical protein